jgi:carbamoyltransferase
MNILGISAFYHDSAACLLRDGELIAAAQEERFSRVRHDAGFPGRAIRYCLEEGGLNTDAVDCVAYYEKPFLKFERILETVVENAPAGYWLAMKALPVWVKDKLWMRKRLLKELGRKIPVYFTGHHESHAASAFFPSPFDEAATLTVDGVGEEATTTWGVGRQATLRLYEEIRYPNSLGLLYSAITQYLGFKVNSAEYKVMGLAPYGEPKYVDKIRSLVEIFPDGSYLLQMRYFSFSKRLEMIHPRLERLFGRKRRVPESDIEPFHADLARSLQAVTEEIMLGLARYVHGKTGMKNLCLAGGVALNCVANGRILREGPFKNIWIQPGAGDSGGAVGAALTIYHHVFKKPRAVPLRDFQKGSFLGPAFGSEEITEVLKECGLRYETFGEEELFAQTAKHLGDQKIVGWFQGRMEFGPRALGARSILGDARNKDMQRRMNLKIKFRESFRPFAPAVVAEDVENYFDLDCPSPYMLLTCSVRQKNERVIRVATGNGRRWMHDLLDANNGAIPAVTHVDDSARVQTVDSMTNPMFYKLLKAFKDKTGSSVLINTSFNVRGEPIVCSPRDAIRCFVKSDIDVLSIGNHVVCRKGQDEIRMARLREQFTREDSFELD